MNIPWTESPAGLISSQYQDYTKFGSYQYLGAKSPYLEYVCDSSLSSSTSICNTVGHTQYTLYGY